MNLFGKNGTIGVIFSKVLLYPKWVTFRLKECSHFRKGNYFICVSVNIDDLYTN